MGTPAFAFVIPWPIDTHGGVNHVIHNLARECAADGTFEPLFLESSWAHPDPVEDRVDGVRRIRLRMRTPLHEDARIAWEYPAFLPAEAIKWLRIIRENRIAVLNPHFPHLHQVTVSLLKSAGLFRGKLIASFHGSDVRQIVASTGAERRAIRAVLRSCDAIVPCSGGLGEELLPLDESLRPKLLPVLNGVSVGEFLGRIDRQFKASDVLPDRRRIILNVGSYQYRKGHDLLLRAFRQVLDRFPDAFLVIVGAKGPEFEATRALAAELGVSGDVKFFVDEPYSRIPVFMKRADVFALASRWIKGKMGEGMPLSVLEAGAAGMPVVSTRSTGVDEIIEDGKDGWLVPLEDSDALAVALIDSLGRMQESLIRAERLRSKVFREFTWASRWQRYRQIAGR